MLSKKIENRPHTSTCIITNIGGKTLSVKLLTKNTTPGTVMLKKKRHSV